MNHLKKTNDFIYLVDYIVNMAEVDSFDRAVVADMVALACSLLDILETIIIIYHS